MSKNSNPKSLFGRRLREARLRIGIAQDKLGVLIGMDESCSSARISRYETGVHEPPIAIVEKIATTLKLPLPYFYCEDDVLAELIVLYYSLNDNQKSNILAYAKDFLHF
jgi:transcriptional regulator with XRE-family HTH domain